LGRVFAEESSDCSPLIERRRQEAAFGEIEGEEFVSEKNMLYE
jgi:hypothetical protein